ncbi:uncharacterized protein LOC126791925 [Argentina anserina]|uniref:uncharacterized protein LOC126791925 n=1 Tax=Argentina anserina TaxID=57926 RepID=UPI0021762F80|nr:uncharacterized protein LOC126791925 [Potentilla anserina]
MKPATVPISALSAKQEKVLDKVEKRAAYWNADHVPIYAVGAFVALVVGFAIHSAKQQLVHAPAVSLRKSKRESLPEVDDPDAVIGSADKFINKSFFRKVAHVQDDRNAVHDPSRPNPFTAPRKAETLKSVGVEPSRH